MKHLLHDRLARWLLGAILALLACIAAFHLPWYESPRAVSTQIDWEKEEWIVLHNVSLASLDQVRNEPEQTELPNIEADKESKTIETSLVEPIHQIIHISNLEKLNTSSIHGALDVAQYDLPSEEHSMQLRNWADSMPEFPGGEAGLLRFIKKEMVYPDRARVLEVEGEVLVQFVVDENGSIQDAVVLLESRPEFNAEALRVIRSMPNWKSARHNGRAVRIRHVVPIRFELN